MKPCWLILTLLIKLEHNYINLNKKIKKQINTLYEGLQEIFTLKGFYFKQMFIEFVHVKEGGLFCANKISNAN